LPYASPWGNGKRNHPGPFVNITSCPTVCTSNIVKELQNITGSDEPQGAVEIEDLFKQGNRRNPLRHGGHNDMEIANITYMSGHRAGEQSVASIRYGTFKKFSRLNNNMYGYFDTISALSSFKIW
jgi:hypothetical protein